MYGLLKKQTLVVRSGVEGHIGICARDEDKIRFFSSKLLLVVRQNNGTKGDKGQTGWLPKPLRTIRGTLPTSSRHIHTNHWYYVLAMIIWSVPYSVTAHFMSPAEVQAVFFFVLLFNPTVRFADMILRLDNYIFVLFMTNA